MIKNKKTPPRPEITIIGARPMSEFSLPNDTFTRARQVYSPTENQKENDRPSNGFNVTAISRTSTLPSSKGHEKKQRPKSEIYNGFTSLRPMKSTKVDVEQLRKESKKVTRSKSLYAPKKPPRDLSLRPAVVPTGNGSIEVKSPIGQPTSISPNRPAPPVPFLSFNKKGAASKQPEAGTSRKGEIKESTKRTRSKSTSTVNDKTKSCGPATLPRGKSFNNHGPRQVIKPTQEENVVILTRAESLDESRGTDVKLRSFGVKVSKSTNNFQRKESVTATDACRVEEAVQSEQRSIDNAENALNGRVTLSDAIQANAVYARLQQKSEVLSADSNNLNNEKKTEISNSNNAGISLSEAINSSAVLTKIKEKRKNLDETIIAEVDKKANLNSSESDEILKPSEEVEAKFDCMNICKTGKIEGGLQNGSAIATDDTVNMARPSASSVMKTARSFDASRADSNVVKVTSSVEMSNGSPPTRKKSVPPTVKPKPSLPKRASFETTNQRSFEEERSEEKNKPLVINSRSSFRTAPPVITNTEACTPDSLDSSRFPGDIQSEEISHRISTRISSRQINLVENERNEAEKASEKSVLQRDLAEDESHIQKGKIDDDNVFSEPYALPRTKSDSTADKRDNVVDERMSYDASALPRTVSESRSDRRDKVVDDNVFDETLDFSRKKSESEPESSGSVDSLTSVASQITVIYNGDVSNSTADASTKVATPVPFDTHTTLSRKNSAPEPYSSHRGRRPKPGKPPPTAMTSKLRNRKSRSMIGRRLTSSPPSTPPPPPRISSSDTTSQGFTENQPPIPPRAPGTLIQSDIRSLDSMVNKDGLQENETTKSPPPPRPSKPPSVKHAFTVISGKGYGKHRDASPLGMDTQNRMQNSEYITDHSETDSVKGTNSTPTDAARLASDDKCPGVGSGTDTSKQNSFTPKHIETNGNFSQKLEFFKNSQKQKQEPTLLKQRSFDAVKERPSPSKEEQVCEKNVEQLRREGEEALAIVSQLRKENPDIKVTNRKRSPAPQKPSRPLSFSMENFIMCSESFDAAKESTTEIGNLKSKQPPPKPGRTLSNFKASSLDDRKVEEAKQLNTWSLVELRSKDAGLNESSKTPTEKKVVPKKPARTSSLRVKDTETPKVKLKKGSICEIELKDNKTRSSGINLSKEDLVLKSNSLNDELSKSSSKIEHTNLLKDKLKEEGNSDKNDLSYEKQAPISEKVEPISDKDEGKSGENGVEEVDFKQELNGRNMSDNPQTLKIVEVKSIASDVKKDFLSEGQGEEGSNEFIEGPNEQETITENVADALSSQIEKLDKIILETSHVLSESYCSVENSFVEPTSAAEVDSGSFINTNLHDSSADIDSSVAVDMIDCEWNSPEEAVVMSHDNKETSAVRKNMTFSPGVLSDGEFVAQQTPLLLAQVEMDKLLNCSPPVLPSNKLETKHRNVNHNSREEAPSLDSTELSNKDVQNLKIAGKIYEEKTFSNESANTFTELVSPIYDINPKISKTDLAVDESEPVGDISHKISNQQTCQQIPSKPLRPRAFPKVINTNFLVNSGQGEHRKIPPRPPSLAKTQEKSNPTRRNSAPARPIAPPTSYRSRPPIPSILRENSFESGIERTSDLLTTVKRNTDDVNPHAVALYDYATSDTKDLKFKVGDLISLEYKVNADWYYGSMQDRKGMFPVNRVDVIVPLSSDNADPCVGEELLTLDRPFALAIYDFIAGNENELTFMSGDAIELLAKKNEDWFEGRCNGQKGDFPASFVVVVKSLPENNEVYVQIDSSGEIAISKQSVNEHEKEILEDSRQSDSIAKSNATSNCQLSERDLSGRLCIAVADYVSETKGDLCFTIGQEIRIISDVDSEWLRGVILDRTGIFPKDFVKITNDQDEISLAEVQVADAPSLEENQQRIQFGDSPTP